MKQSWKFAGVEIEGGWKDTSKVLPIFKSDGSVRVPNYLSYYDDVFYRGEWDDLTPEMQHAPKIKSKGAAYSGEVASPKLKNKKEIKNFIAKNYPDNTDWSCGLHIHISFDSLIKYAGIMTKSFHEQFMSMMNKFGDKYGYSDTETEYNFWARFKGDNSYCQKSFAPLPFQAAKYTMMNFSAFKHDRRTFECRAFPAFASKEVAYKAIESYLNLVDSYLANWLDVNDTEVQNNLRILKGYLTADEPLNK
jgi:hypothetical protein